MLEKVSFAAPDIRFRFMSPHPKDFPEPLLDIISSRENICNHIHLPLQSGSDNILAKMRRNYSQQAYLELVHRIKDKIKDVFISTDIVVGFCSETEADFKETKEVVQ